jgi:hypothetical protein
MSTIVGERNAATCDPGTPAAQSYGYDAEASDGWRDSEETDEGRDYDASQVVQVRAAVCDVVVRWGVVSRDHCVVESTLLVGSYKMRFMGLSRMILLIQARVCRVGLSPVSPRASVSTTGSAFDMCFGLHAARPCTLS